MISLISFLIVISICVISHEGGHYLAAKWRNVMIHEFSFGMGPSVWSKKIGETLWSLRVFPIGGFVKLQGEDGDSDPDGQETEEYDPTRSLCAKKPWERLTVIAAGATVNLLLAWLLTAALLAGYGVLDLGRPAIGVVMENTPAMSAGLRPGDVIKSINGVELNKWADIKANIQNRKAESDDSFNITIQRGEKEIDCSVNIPYSKEHGGRLLGVQPERIVYPLNTAFAQGLSYSWHMGIEMLRGIWMVLTGRLQTDVVGPVGIAVMAGDALKQGLWSFIAFLGVINLNLGLLNLFPFPALDGGRIIFILFELVTHRRFPEKWESWIHYAGFIILITLIIFITGNDIMRLFK